MAMPLQQYVRQVKPRNESYTPPVVKIQNFLEAKGLDIGELQKIRNDKPRLHILIDVLNNKTPVETTKGKTALNWLSDVDRVALESGDLISAFVKGKKYKPVFVGDNGKQIRLNDILKTDMFGGGRGSGGGAANTDITECVQCIYAAAIFGGETLKDGDDFDASQWGTYSSKFQIDTPLTKISQGLTEDWILSSILIGNELKKNLKGTNWTFHKGSTFVKEIETKFKELNKAETPKPFSNINKWTPADIWAVKDGSIFDFNQFSNLGELTNELKELYDKDILVGISLKKATGTVKTEEKNITGFVRRPVNFNSSKLYKRDFFKSKDVYVYLGNQKIEMQLRTFDVRKSWQGEIKGKSASAGKIGGGVLESILVANSTVIKFPYTNSQLLALCVKPTPAFLEEMYNMYKGLETSPVTMEEFKEKAGDKKVEGKDGPDWRFSKFRGMYFISQLEDNKRIANKVCDNIAAYSLSASDASAPHVVYKS